MGKKLLLKAVWAFILFVMPAQGADQEAAERKKPLRGADQREEASFNPPRFGSQNRNYQHHSAKRQMAQLADQKKNQEGGSQAPKPGQSAGLAEGRQEPFSSRFRMPVEKYQLKNGLRVLLNPDSSSNTASIAMGISVGSRHEREGLTGISHMFEHLMFKGTKKYPDFDKTYAAAGALNINAYTSRDLTAYYVSFPPDRLDLILDVEADRLINLILERDPLEKERQVVLEERRLRVDNDPRGALFEAFFGEVFKKHPYRFPVIGYESDISGYTLEKLKSWHKTYYSPNNVVLALSGRFSAPLAKQLIEKRFGALERKNIPEEALFDEPEPAGPRRREVRKEIQAPPTGLMGYALPGGGTKEALALDLIGSILGSGESSRLHKELVRGKRLASGIWAGNLDFLHYGVFYVFYTLAEEGMEDKARALITEEIRKITEKPLSRRELEKARNLKLNSLVGRLKGGLSRALMIMESEVKFGDYRKAISQIDDIQTLSPEFVQAAAKKYLAPRRMAYLALKPKKPSKKPGRK